MENAAGRDVFRQVLLMRRVKRQVWYEPMLAVARDLGVSDVGLAKACRAHQIPTPPRGYWAKVKAGKSVGKRPRLPAWAGKPDRVVIAPAIKSPVRSQAVHAVLDAVADQPEIPIPHDLRNPHPIVKVWLDQDAATRVRARREGWGASGEDLRHGLAHRRLRLTSALLKALVARGLVVDQAYTWLTARRGEDTVEFRFSERTQFILRPATDFELRWAPERTMVRSAQPAGDLTRPLSSQISAWQGNVARVISTVGAGERTSRTVRMSHEETLRSHRSARS